MTETGRCKTRKRAEFTLVLNLNMKESYIYKKEIQEAYGKHPYSEKYDTNPARFADSMMKIFKKSGILDLMEEEKISVLASSVSTGRKDWEFLQKLDNHLGKLEKLHRPSVTLTDFALKEKNGEMGSIIKRPEQEYKNLDARIVACDSYHLPFKENEFNVLYERLGALWHAAEEDINRDADGKLVKTLLKEYKRVVKPGGKIIVDWASLISPYYSTAEKIHEAVHENVKSFLKKSGFKTEIIGKKIFFGEAEMFIVLTNPDKKSEEE